MWADQATPLSAHTSYWIAEPTRDRLMGRLIPWLEGGHFVSPDQSPPTCRRTGFTVFCVVAAGILTGILWLEATLMIWILERFGGHFESIRLWMGTMLLVNALVVLICSSIRWAWEWKALRLPT